MRYMMCKRCLRLLPEDNFYLQIREQRGKIYANYRTTCKECCSRIYREKKNSTKEYNPHQKYTDVSALPIDQRPKAFTPLVNNPDPLEWVYRTLRLHGNVFVSKKTRAKLNPNLLQEFGSLKARAFENGYIIEVVKN